MCAITPPRMCSAQESTASRPTAFARERRIPRRKRSVLSLVLVCALATALIAGSLVGIGVPARLLSLVVSPVMAGVILRASIVCARRGGMQWRGTVYPARQLIDGRRLELP